MKILGYFSLAAILLGIVVCWHFSNEIATHIVLRNAEMSIDHTIKSTRAQEYLVRHCSEHPDHLRCAMIK